MDNYKPAPRRPWTPEGQLFLHEAFILLGEARFGADWTSEEWTARRGAGDPPHPPAEPKAGEPLKVRQPDRTTREVDRPVRWVVDGTVQIIPYEEARKRYEKEKDELLERWHARRGAVPSIYSICGRNIGILHHRRIFFPACTSSSKTSSPFTAKSSSAARRFTQKSLPSASR